MPVGQGSHTQKECQSEQPLHDSELLILSHHDRSEISQGHALDHTEDGQVDGAKRVLHFVVQHVVVRLGFKCEIHRIFLLLLSQPLSVRKATDMHMKPCAEIERPVT
jgi:hypothetical protein